MEASGQISRRGIVDLAFERFDQVGTATGKLAKGTGSGTWSSTTMRCTGSWRALGKAETGSSQTQEPAKVFLELAETPGVEIRTKRRQQRVYAAQELPN
jgi:hypothetical protein